MSTDGKDQDKNSEEQIIIDDSFLTESEIENLIHMGNSATTSTSAPSSSVTSFADSNGGSGGTSGGGPGGLGYKSRKIELVHFINEFQKDFTTNCFKRTAPYHYTLPVSFARILLGVNALSKGSSKSESLKLDEIIAYLGSKEGGGLKTGDTVRKDLCRMTADPFPLLESAKDKNMGLTSTKDWYAAPLYSMATGLCAAARYSKVGLSYLGEIAVGKYAKLYGKNIKQIGAIKTIVPLALLRKKTMPWTLGHKTVNYSYNPAELFMLQARMLDQAADPNNKTPWLLPDSTVAEIFKGPDVGDHYIGYMTNQSLMSTYHLGVGSMTVVPEIVIDRTANTIEFKVPPLGSTSFDFIDYLNNRSIGKDPETGKVYPKFTTFEITRRIEESDIRVVIRDVIFKGTDDEIIQEIYSDSNIRITTPLNNTILLDDSEDTVKMSVLEENIQDGALDSFKADVMPIHELLWRHILDECDIRVELLKREIKDLEEQLQIERFLEKVTRPAVAHEIGRLHNELTRSITEPNYPGGRLNFKTLLTRAFSLQSTQRDSNLLPEGFCTWEIEEIASESAKSGRTGLNILNAMLYREKYQDRWKVTQDRLQVLQAKKDNRSLIYAEIRQDLMRYASLTRFARKTKMHFVEELRMDKDENIDYNFNFNTQLWDTLYLPCTVYHNGRYVVKSYGRNINIIPTSEADSNMVFTHALNATTNDQIYVFRGRSYDVYHMSQIRCSPMDFGSVDAIIPFSPDKEIMVLLESVSYNEELKAYTYNPSRYFIIPAGGLTNYINIESDERIKSWCYLDKKYVEFLGYSLKPNKQTYARIPTEEIVRVNEPTYLPYQFEVVTDIQATDSDDQSVPLLSNEFDGTSLPTEALYAHWPKEDDVTVLNTIFKDVKYMDYFSTHMECYSDKLYMTNWKKINLVVYQYYTHSKKAIINELIWCRPDDIISTKFDSMIDHKASAFRSKLTLMVSYNTAAYEDYNIGYLADWSVINPRFQLPTYRPNDVDIINFYNNYLHKMFTCEVNRKEYKEIYKEMEEVRARIIAASKQNPFVTQEQLNVPSMDVPSDISVDDSDYTPED